MSAEDRIRRLEEKKAKIAAQLQRERARIAKRKRAEDTRRCILAGRWLLREIERDEQLRLRVEAGLDAWLTRERDRQLFDLPARPAGQN